MNQNAYRKTLPGTADVQYYDTRAAIDAIEPGAYAGLPYTSRILAEQLVRRCDPALLTDALKQLIYRKRDLDFPWYPARVVCHDILGQTALVDLAGLRDAIAEQGGDPAQVNPVVPTQLIVDHSLAVEYAPRGIRERRHAGRSAHADERPPAPHGRSGGAGTARGASPARTGHPGGCGPGLHLPAERRRPVGDRLEPHRGRGIYRHVT